MNDSIDSSNALQVTTKIPTAGEVAEQQPAEQQPAEQQPAEQQPAETPSQVDLQLPVIALNRLITDGASESRSASSMKIPSEGPNGVLVVPDDLIHTTPTRKVVPNRSHRSDAYNVSTDMSLMVQLYNELRELSEKRVENITPANIVSFVTHIMIAVESYPRLTGERKKRLVLKTIRWYVRDCVKVDEDIVVFIDNFLPNIIDTLVYLDTGDALMNVDKGCRCTIA